MQQNRILRPARQSCCECREDAVPSRQNEEQDKLAPEDERTPSQSPLELKQGEHSSENKSTCALNGFRYG